MQKVKVEVTLKVPYGGYCNYEAVRFRGMPADKRCRFCTEVKKGSYKCVLHDENLSFIHGALVQKCESCMRHAKKVVVEYDEPSVEKEVKVNPKEVIDWTIRKYTKIYAQLERDGYPPELASKLAAKAVKEEANG